eukprot:3092419-Rhodomonas_salina.2
MRVGVHGSVTKAAFSGPGTSVVSGDFCRCLETETPSLKEVANSELRKSRVRPFPTPPDRCRPEE